MRSNTPSAAGSTLRLLACLEGRKHSLAQVPDEDDTSQCESGTVSNSQVAGQLLRVNDLLSPEPDEGVRGASRWGRASTAWAVEEAWLPVADGRG